MSTENVKKISAGLSPFAHEGVTIQAERLMLFQIADHLSHGRSFALETTLSGLALQTTVNKGQA